LSTIAKKNQYNDRVDQINRKLDFKRALKQIVAVFGVWTLMAILFTPQTYLANLSTPKPLNIWQAFQATLFPFYSWAILTPPIFWLCSRVTLEQSRLLRRILLHVFFSIYFCLAQLVFIS
jgi:hypothetical protein